MGTKTTTTSTNQYNNGSMNTYNAFQPRLGSTLMSMVQNPLGNSYFQNQLAQAQAASRQIANRNNTNAIRNMRTGGGILSNAGGFAAGMLNRNNLAASNMQANAFNSALNSALSNRGMAMTAMEAYQPLQTGQTSTQQTGGLGTWLPQVAGMAMNALMPGLGSMMGGGSFSSGYRGMGGGGYSMPRSSGAMAPPMMSSNPYSNPFGYGGWGAGPSAGLPY